MITLVASPPRFVRPREGRAHWPLGVLCAVTAHAALGLWAARSEPPARDLVFTTIVELAPKAAPAPDPVAPARDPEPEPPKAVAAPRSPSRAPTKAAAPSAAAAAEVRTVGETAPTPTAPVRFVSDPNGKGFGFGIVARGGTARVGTGASTAALPARFPAPAPSAKPAARPALSSPPRLHEADPCAGEFPSEAQWDRGEALLELTVAASGRVTSTKVLEEAPVGQGFGRAAQRCLARKTFEPARDLAGLPVSAQAPVRVRFSR